MSRLIQVLLFMVIYQTPCIAQENKPNTSTSQKQPIAEGTLKLYPNPATTYTNIYVDWNSVQSFSITIYDMQYKATLNTIQVNSRKNYQYALDVSKLPAGQYKISVTNTAGKTLEQVLTKSQ